MDFVLDILNNTGKRKSKQAILKIQKFEGEKKKLLERKKLDSMVNLKIDRKSVSINHIQTQIQTIFGEMEETFSCELDSNQSDNFDTITKEENRKFDLFFSSKRVFVIDSITS